MTVGRFFRNAMMIASLVVVSACGQRYEYHNVGSGRMYKVDRLTGEIWLVERGIQRRVEDYAAPNNTEEAAPDAEEVAPRPDEGASATDEIAPASENVASKPEKAAVIIEELPRQKTGEQGFWDDVLEYTRREQSLTVPAAQVTGDGDN